MNLTRCYDPLYVVFEIAGSTVALENFIVLQGDSYFTKDVATFMNIMKKYQLGQHFSRLPLRTC